MDRIPRPVRWIMFVLIPTPAALLAGAVGPFILSLLGWLPGNPDDWKIYAARAVIGAFVFGYTGYAIAPTHKFGFGIIQPTIYGVVHLVFFTASIIGLIILEQPFDFNRYSYLLGPLAGVLSTLAVVLLLRRKSLRDKQAVEMSTAPTSQT